MKNKHYIFCLKKYTYITASKKMPFGTKKKQKMKKLKKKLKS